MTNLVINRAKLERTLKVLKPLTAYGRVGSRDVEQAAAQAAISDLEDALEQHGVGAVLSQVLTALEKANAFIANGVALGFIRMPDVDTPDPAHETPMAVHEAIAALKALQSEVPSNVSVNPDTDDDQEDPAQLAYEIGAKGAKPTEAERLLFESWMRGHCWAIVGDWNGETYVHKQENIGFVHPGAMHTRSLWAAWRDRAAISPHQARQS